MKVGDAVYIGEKVRGRITSARAAQVESVTPRYIIAGGKRFWKTTGRALLGFKEVWLPDAATRSFLNKFPKHPR